MSLIDMLETPEKYIPNGYYCYSGDRNTPCPFWEMKTGEYPPQEDGYCHYLHESDWDANSNSTAKIIFVDDDKSLEGKTVNEVFDDGEIDPISGKVTHFTSSLLFDQVKSCEINMEEDDDTVIVQYNSSTGEKTLTTAGQIKKGK